MDIARLWWVRCSGDTRLRLASARLDCEAAERDLVIVRDSLGARIPARIVGACRSVADGQVPALSIERRIIISPGSAITLSNFIVPEDASERADSGHRWGALGAPAGPETPVSTANVASDVELAVASAGFQEVRRERIHQIVPGDRCLLEGRRVVVTAIDRRNNQIELTHGPCEGSMTIALDEFIRRESRE